MKAIILSLFLLPTFTLAAERGVSSSAAARGGSRAEACGIASTQARIRMYCMGSLSGTTCQTDLRRDRHGYICYASCYGICRTQSWSPSPRR